MVIDVYEGMTLKEIQEQMRSEKVAEFGDIGVKEYCEHFQVSLNGARSCDILRKLFCRCEVCHFYSRG